MNARDLATVAASAALGIAAAAALAVAMDRDHLSMPVSTPTVTITAQPWADGCTTDADCARWDTPTLPDSCDVTFEGDEAHLYPCVDHPVESITGPDGDLHNACAVILTTAEDSVAVCADGTEWPS